ncbi:MAG TPA: rhomboid family intramembrane serine protease [Polyangiaceae bacterium]|nr:rhomboid family intramembrane serine protease [Polyangiaceae bacterium]
MDRLLARLERRIGRYAIPNLIVYVLVGMAVVWLISQQRPWAVERLSLDLGAVRRGELWRLVSFLLIPLGWDSLTFLLSLYALWWVGSSLEQHWGAFRFNVYYLLGALGAIAAACIAGRASNLWLDTSMMLALATLFPDLQILVFFILPLRAKWLGLLTAAGVAIALVRADWTTRASIFAALANYGVFFGGHWVDVLRSREVAVRQKARRESLRSSAPAFGQRVCAICGAREADGADIRVCSCDKCEGKPRALCLDHARNH